MNNRNKENEPKRWELVGAIIVVIALTLLSALAMVGGGIALYGKFVA